MLFRLLKERRVIGRFIAAFIAPFFDCYDVCRTPVGNQQVCSVRRVKKGLQCGNPRQEPYEIILNSIRRAVRCKCCSDQVMPYALLAEVDLQPIHQEPDEILGQRSARYRIRAYRLRHQKAEMQRETQSVLKNYADDA